jgi:hypothetical protein
MSGLPQKQYYGRGKKYGTEDTDTIGCRIPKSSKEWFENENVDIGMLLHQIANQQLTLGDTPSYWETVAKKLIKIFYEKEITLDANPFTPQEVEVVQRIIEGL